MSDTTTQNYTTSTYLIDASKKIFVKGQSTEDPVFPTDTAPDTLKGISVFAAGIIDDTALQNLGFEYTEGFTSGKKVAEERFEDVIKPATMAVKALTSALPIMKGIGSRVDSVEKLRTTAIEGYTLLAGTTTLLGNSNTDTDVTSTLNDWQAVYQYDPPVRKGPPSVDLQRNPIDITFRYGACNVFDAFWEVYYPITQIYKALFPQAKVKTDKKGLAGYDGQYNVPYEQQVFVQLLKNILPKKTEENKAPGEPSETDTDNIFVDLKELASAKSTLDREADLFEERKNNLINGLDKSLGGLKIEDIRKYSSFASKLQSKIFEPLGLDNVTIPQIEDACPSDNEKGSVHAAIAGLIETAIEEKRLSGDVTITDGSWKGGNDFWDWITLGKPDIDNLLPDSPGGIKVVVKPKSTSNKAATLKNVFKSLVTFEPRIIGQTLDNIYTTWIQKCCTDIYFGFPCVYGRSLSDFKDTIYSKPKDYAKIHIQNVVLGNVAISFDFSNTDERGYPLEGHVVLKGMWNCTLPQEVLVFEDGKSPKDTVKMKEQI